MSNGDADGLGRWEQSSAGKTQVSAKVPDQLKADFEDACEAAGKTQTDVITRKMAEFVDDQGVGTYAGPLFDDDTLAAGYQALRERADPDTNFIGPEAAETAVAQQTGIRATAVRRRVLDPLERRDAIRYNWGKIAVAPRPYLVASTAEGSA